MTWLRLFLYGGSLIPYGHIVQNPKDRQEEDDKETTGAAGAAIATATTAAVADRERKDCDGIYSYSSCSFQRKRSPNQYYIE